MYTRDRAISTQIKSKIRNKDQWKNDENQSKTIDVGTQQWPLGARSTSNGFRSLTKACRTPGQERGTCFCRNWQWQLFSARTIKNTIPMKGAPTNSKWKVSNSRWTVNEQSVNIKDTPTEINENWIGVEEKSIKVKGTPTTESKWKDNERSPRRSS